MSSHEWIDARHTLQAMGRTLSPAHYRHASEDVLAACRAVPGQSASIISRAGANFGVISAVSPWVELTLLKFNPDANITTVDYNCPIIESDDPHDARLAPCSNCSLARPLAPIACVAR